VFSQPVKFTNLASLRDPHTPECFGKKSGFTSRLRFKKNAAFAILLYTAFLDS
jgi:hypothetical protein